MVEGMRNEKPRRIAGYIRAHVAHESICFGVVVFDGGHTFSAIRFSAPGIGFQNLVFGVSSRREEQHVFNTASCCFSEHT